MGERPILFKPEMVLAILEGEKTRTRRTKGLEQVNEAPDEWVFEGKVVDSVEKRDVGKYCFLNEESGECAYVKCPYGKVGDHLWVREKCK